MNDGVCLHGQTPQKPAEELQLQGCCWCDGQTDELDKEFGFISTEMLISSFPLTKQTSNRNPSDLFVWKPASTVMNMINRISHLRAQIDAALRPVSQSQFNRNSLGLFWILYSITWAQPLKCTQSIKGKNIQRQKNLPADGYTYVLSYLIIYY